MKRLTIGFALIMAALSGAFAQNELQPLAIVKLHKSDTITLKQLKARANIAEKQLQAYGTSLSTEQKVKLRQSTLEDMIAQKLIVQQAAKENLVITDSQVNAAFVSSFNQGGRQMTEAQLEEECKKATGKSLADYTLEVTGMSVKDYKDYIRESLVVQQYVLSKKQEEAKKISATDKEVSDFYDMNKTKFVWDDMAKLFLYVVPKNNNSDAAKANATAALKKAAGGQNARTDLIKASDNGKVYQAGELMLHKNPQTARAQGLTVESMNEIFEHSVGYASEVMDGGNNWQFFVILDKYSAKMLKLNDIVEPGSKLTVREYIKGNLTNQKQAQFMQKAAQDMVKSLNTSSNVDRKKTGDALTKLLSW